MIGGIEKQRLVKLRSGCRRWPAAVRVRILGGLMEN